MCKGSLSVRDMGWKLKGDQKTSREYLVLTGNKPLSGESNSPDLRGFVVSVCGICGVV